MTSLGKKGSLGLGGVLAVGGLVLTPNCASEKEGDTAGVSKAGEKGVVISAATWTLEWKTEGVVFDPQGGFALTTNLGYDVKIVQGYHVLHGVSLGQCPIEAQATAWFGVQSAMAHTEEEDASAIETLFITDLRQKPQPQEIGASAFAPARYCKAFALLARGMPGAISEDGTDLENRSIYFEGSYRKGEQTGTILLDTWWPQSRLVELADVIEPATYQKTANEASSHFAFIKIRVPLGTAFDNIDFATDIEPVKLDTVVDNLATNVEFVVDLQTP